MASSPRSGPFAVTVHPFDSPTTQSCAYEMGSRRSHNALVFIGGLGDGPHTVPYIRTIATQLEATDDLSYSVFEIRMSSSFDGFGFKRLKDDVMDLSALTKYLRGLGKGKIVFLGHSTGCQDIMEYTDYAKHNSEPVDGFILQGPVSDREAFSQLMVKRELDESLALAASMIASGKDNAIMPREALPPFFSTPITAYRWNSLLSYGGDDDYFSSDLSDAKLASYWSRFQKPVLILPSGEDEHVPDSIDVIANVERWKSLCAPGIASDRSGFIPGASHTVNQAQAQIWMAERVIGFLKSLEK